jgi:hypothetical protein
MWYGGGWLAQKIAPETFREDLPNFMLPHRGPPGRHRRRPLHGLPNVWDHSWKGLTVLAPLQSADADPYQSMVENLKDIQNYSGAYMYTGGKTASPGAAKEALAAAVEIKAML